MTSSVQAGDYVSPSFDFGSSSADNNGTLYTCTSYWYAGTVKGYATTQTGGNIPGGNVITGGSGTSSHHIIFPWATYNGGTYFVERDENWVHGFLTHPGNGFNLNNEDFRITGTTGLGSCAESDNGTLAIFANGNVYVYFGTDNNPNAAPTQASNPDPF